MRASLVAARAGFGLALARLRPRGLIVLALGLAGALAAALVERATAPMSAPDRSLAFACGFVLPLVALAVVSLATGAEELGASVWCLSRHGLSRRASLLGVGLAVVAATALAALVIVEATLAVAHGGSPGGDALTSGWIAALGAAAYASLALAGARLLRRGRGRYLVVLLDLLLGGGHVWGLPWPRAHLASLLGGPAAYGLSQADSSLVLGAVALGAGLVATVVARD
ncbi:MAG: hypothetical protein HY908_12915 [Myxococcales bacterium]|nr:hypothetical protein [Myxococcales bacterium]